MDTVSKIIFPIYLLVFVTILIEICLRWGIVKTDLYLKYEEIAAISSSRKPKVLILGDSFSLENPNSAMARTRKTFSNLQFLNLAGQGYGPEQYLEQLNRFGSKFNPDIILLNYYVGNDLTDTLYPSNKNAIKTWLIHLTQYSYLLSHLRTLNAAWAAKKRIQSIENEIGQRVQGESVLNPFLFDLAKHHPEYLEQNLMIKSVEAEEAWEKNKRILKLIAENAKKLNSKLLIHIFPSTVQVNGTHYSFYSKIGFQLSSDFSKSSIPQKFLLTFCKEQHLSCYDLLPEFKKRGRYEKWLFKADDDHWNSEGNELAARIIEANLRSYLKNLP